MFRWEEVMLLKIVSSQFKRMQLTVIAVLHGNVTVVDRSVQW